MPEVNELEEPESEEPFEKTDLYVTATLNTIQKVIKQGFEYKDIVILSRKKSQGIAIANYLTEQKIPLLSSETLMIQNATEVRFIIHVLKYLRNTLDLEAKAYFLEYLAQNNQNQLPVHDFIAQGMALTNENEFENWFEKLNINLSFQNIRKKSLYEMVEIIISKFLNATNTNAYVQYFLDIVLERDIRNQSGISDFLNYWDKNAQKFSIPSPEGTNAVRIMTIHKSKGLEFPVVIFPFAENDYNKDPKQKLWINTKEEADFGFEKVLIDNSKAVEGFGEEANELYNQKKQEELLDNINVLYVALTRAEEQLYIISNMNLSRNRELPKNNMCSFFIKFLINKNLFEENKFEYEFGNAIRLSENEKHVDTTKTIPLVAEVLNSKNIKIAQRESLMWGSHQQDAIEYGNIIHEILALVKTRADIDLAITKSIENGLITHNQKQLVYKAIYEIVNHSELSNCFSSENKVMNEQTIIQKEGNTIKPDRMVLNTKNEVFLIDYKTGKHNTKYQLQLNNYQNEIEKMGYKVLQKTLVYIGEQIEVVNF